MSIDWEKFQEERQEAGKSDSTGPCHECRGCEEYEICRAAEPVGQ